ncbi:MULTISPECIES: hypothetical protein [Sphingomonas]|uniref:hypothetical protein n=1 Tax=Sphingomonas TaxID=13687 RepID=UPI000DEEB15A|nr:MULTISPECIES: hypothetical protein [Sphingomonas]
MLERFNSLWFGSELGYLEQLSIKSAQALGHEYTLYSYEPEQLRGVPAGVDLRDANEVMSDPKRTKHFAGKFKALGSDFFRYELLAKELGYWVDLDLIFLKPFDFAEPHVFGWEREGSINGAVLKMPAESPMLKVLRDIPERNWCPPFFGPRRKLEYYWQRLRGDVELEDLPWGVAGPGLITYLAKKMGFAAQAQAKPVFYPIDYFEAEILFGPRAEVERHLTPDTHAIHMWHSRIVKRAGTAPEPGSYLAELCAEHGVGG